MAVAVAPSVSYSITVRLEVPSHGRAVSELTHAVEQVGGAVTALVAVVVLVVDEAVELEPALQVIAPAPIWV